MGRRGASGGGHGLVQVGRGVDGVEAVIAARARPVRAAIVAALLLGIVGLGSAGAGGPTSGQQAQAVGDACRTVFQTPAHPGDPVITQVILVATGEVVATRTGHGPFEPADYAERCTSVDKAQEAPSSTQQAQAVGDACRTVFQTPAHPGDPVITQVILVATGEVVATRTGHGPFEPADYAERCNGAVQQPSAPPVAPPAAPISDSASFTG